MLAALVFGLAIVGATVALAGDGADKPIPEARQTKLLEKYGEDGIDANEDGVLTRDEVRAFFAERDDEWMPGPHGRRGHGPRALRDGEGFGPQGMRGKGPGPCGSCDGEGFGPKGMRGKGPGPMGQMERMFERLEMLAAETPPEDFDLARFPRADANEDGELSQDEWTLFAEKARERMLSRLLKRHPGVDTDEDGSISDTELAAFAAEQDAKMRERILSMHPDADTDGDAVLSDEELEAFKESRAAERRARLLERHPKADLDGDGVLSQEEEEAFRADHPRPPRGPHRGHGRGMKGDCSGLEDL
jgi:hypothetical protein